MTESITNRVIRLDSDHEAIAVWTPVAGDPREVLERLGLSGPSPVLVVCSGPAADELADAAIVNATAGHAVAAAARHTRAIVVDRGVQAGVAPHVGEARTEEFQPFETLVGVAPAGLVSLTPDGREEVARRAPSRVDLEPHHTHLVLTDGDHWGAGLPLVLALAEALARRPSDDRAVLADTTGGLPVAAMLAGGGDPELNEAAAAVDRGWPLLVVCGSGGTADQIAAAASGGRRDNDPRVRRLAAGDRVILMPGTDMAEMTRQLTWALDADTALQDAWKLCATYDRMAVHLRRTFERLQVAILALGVIATLLALLHQVLGTQGLRWAVIAASLTVSAAIAMTGRRATGKRWVLTRAVAESVKSEIFRYRTRTGSYAGHKLPSGERLPRPDVLVARLEVLQQQLMHSEVSGGPLPPYVGPLPPDRSVTGDDGLRPLGPEAYLELRVRDQLRYYHRRLRQLHRRRDVLQTLAVVASATGALVAAAGAETWVALTTAVGAAALAYLAHLQVESTIVDYNQAAARIEQVMRRWHGLNRAAQTWRAFTELVDGTERALAVERGAWLEQMSEAVREGQEREREQLSARHLTEAEPADD